MYVLSEEHACALVGVHGNVPISMSVSVCVLECVGESA